VLNQRRDVVMRMKALNFMLCRPVGVPRT
jgi:hypothetical protein